MTVVREMPESRYILTPLSVVANVHVCHLEIVYCSVQMGSYFFHRVNIYTLKPTQLFSAGVYFRILLG